MKKFFTLEVPIFRYDILVSVGQTDEELVKKLPPRIPKSSINYNGRVGFVANYSNGSSLLRMRRLKKDEIGDWSHEIFHLATAITRHAGIKFSDKSDEVWAYLIGYLTEQILKNCDKGYGNLTKVYKNFYKD